MGTRSGGLGSPASVVGGFLQELLVLLHGCRTQQAVTLHLGEADRAGLCQRVVGVHEPNPARAVSSIQVPAAACPTSLLMA